jgi:hypothetical protein
MDQYADVTMAASGGVIFQNSGSLAVQGNLALTTPLITGTKGAVQAIQAGGALDIAAPAAGAATVTPGLGASLALQGTQVTVDSDILLPSGALTLHATGGDLTVGGRLDVGGTAQTFYDLAKYTDGGQITLSSDTGSVIVAADGVINVAAQTGGGKAGSLSIDAPTGSFTVAGSLFGQGSTGGEQGTFSLDVGSLPSAGALNAVLNAASFSQSRSIRVRTGDVLVDGLATVRNFNLSADQGSINVTGTIDASGISGGSINLGAS